jgi:hypothetical protein
LWKSYVIHDMHLCTESGINILQRKYIRPLSDGDLLGRKMVLSQPALLGFFGVVLRLAAKSRRGTVVGRHVAGSFVQRVSRRSGAPERGQVGKLRERGML